MSDYIAYTRDERIGTIVIDRPEKKNAMTFAMLADFTRLVAEAGNDPDVSVLIVTGVPGAFCAGTDLSDLSSIPGEQRGLRGTAEETEKWWPLVQCSKPTICLIDGPAIGMGAEFTSQCDLRIATSSSIRAR
jgi:enoyl-CoA hydratase